MACSIQLVAGGGDRPPNLDDVAAGKPSALEDMPIQLHGDTTPASFETNITAGATGKGGMSWNGR